MVIAVFAVAFAAFTGFANGRGGEPTTESVLSGAVCSETAQRLCLGTPISALRPDMSAVFALGTRPTAESDDSVEQAATPTPTPAPEPEPEPQPTPEPVEWATMEVRPGDSLIALAAWFGVSPFDIAVFNGMAVDDYLIIGQTLWIPVPVQEFVLPPEAVTEEPPAVVAQPDPVPQQPPAAIIAPPAPAPAPAPTPPPSSGSWTKEEVVQAICSLPWDCEKMVAVAACESGLRPNAYNPLGYYGLFQINYQFPGWDDPWVNASVAYHDKYLPSLNWSGNGLAPWPVCQYA